MEYFNCSGRLKQAMSEALDMVETNANSMTNKTIGYWLD